MLTGRSRSYWAQGLDAPEFSCVKEDVDCDVVVIGAGVTGLTAAAMLHEAGCRVVVLERKTIGAGDSGLTTAHITAVTDKPLSRLGTAVGRDHASAAWDAGLSAIEELHRIVHAFRLECGFEFCEGYFHSAPGTSPSIDLRAETDLWHSAGLEASYIPSLEPWQVPAIRVERNARFHPLEYLFGLAQRLHAKGVRIFQHSAVSSFLDGEARGVVANGHAVRGRDILNAVHIPLQGSRSTLPALLFQTKIWPYTSYVLRAELPQSYAGPLGLLWDDADPYFYARVEETERSRFVIFGGRDEKTGQERDSEENYRLLADELRARFGSSEVTHRWCGQVIETPDGLPYIGDVGNGHFLATGYSGNGFTFGVVAARMFADQVIGRSNPWRELFDPKRTVGVRGTWDYLKENLDYPYYMSKQLLMRARTADPESLAPGEGMILKLDGESVAACRDRTGALHMVSPKCTHLGCAVRFNSADQSWDCPCHGSRFAPDGSVIAGPAESPLEPRPVR